MEDLNSNTQEGRKEKEKEKEKEEEIPRLNNVAEPPRSRRDKGGETAGRSSAVALNGVDSLSLSPPDLVLFSSFHLVLDVWVILGLYLKVT